jgi:DNA replication protein DnaC
MSNAIIPSRLTSWVVWRNIYTTPGGQPFNLLREELGATGSLYHAFRDRYAECPHCKRSVILNTEKWGWIFCLCEVLRHQEARISLYRDIRTDIAPATLKEIDYSKAGNGKKQLEKAVEATANFIMKPDKWLGFSGRLGTGKTHLLRAINSQMWPMSVYIAARELESLTHMHRKEDTLSDFVYTLQRAPILLIDDVGMEYGGELLLSIYDRVIDFRYARFPDYPLVITTNLKWTYLFDYIKRGGDRIREKRIANLYPMDFESFRRVP